jgi:O-antigen/teichoic acid export membrane protein
VSPAAFVLWTEHATLGSVLVSMVFARIAGLLIMLGLILPRLGITSRQLRWNFSLALLMFKFGGWVALSNLISPIMNYIDRFVLSSLLGARQAAGYLAAAELISRAAPVPAALSAALFPQLCANPDDKVTVQRAMQLMVGVCVALSVVLWFWGDLVLSLWLGRSLMPQSLELLRILLLGFLFNAIAHLPFARLHAGGHTRSTAILHAAEILPFLGLLFVLVRTMGPTGAAIAWVVRMGVDLLGMLLLDWFAVRAGRWGPNAACVVR